MSSPRCSGQDLGGDRFSHEGDVCHSYTQYCGHQKMYTFYAKRCRNRKYSTNSTKTHSKSRQPQEKKQSQCVSGVEVVHSTKRVRAECPAFGKKCSKCGKENHFAKMCLSTQDVRHKSHPGTVHQVEEYGSQGVPYTLSRPYKKYMQYTTNQARGTLQLYNCPFQVSVITVYGVRLTQLQQSMSCLEMLYRSIYSKP